MLAFRRSLLLRGGAIERTGTFRIADGFRLYLMEMTGGVVFDGGLVAAAGGEVREVPYAGRSNAVFVLSGRLRLRRDARELVVPAGHGVLEPVTSWDERWEGDPFRALAVEWAPHRGAPAHATTPLAPSRALASLVGDMATVLSRPRSVAHEAFLAHAAFQILSALGLDHGGATPLDAAPHPLQADADLLAAAVSRLDTQPMWIDLEKDGLSERALRRRFGALPLGGRRGLRAALHRHRLLSCITLLSAPDLPVGAVARALGYGTTRALGTALEKAGLPAASEIQRRLRARD
jgi:hypothetical protein